MGGKKHDVITAPHGLRLENGMSIFKSKYTLIDKVGYVSCRKTVISDVEYDVEIMSYASLTPHHGSLFDYAMALGHNGNKDTVTFNINEYLKLCGKDTKNSRQRASVVKTVDELQGIRVKLDSKEVKVGFTLLTGSLYDKITGEITLSFNRKDLDRYFENLMTRYTNLSQTLPLKSGDLKEFLKFLQLNGRQLKKGGDAQWAKEFSIIQIAEYMHWLDEEDNRSDDSIIRSLERLLREAQKEIPNFPKYHRKKSLPELVKWVRE